MTVNRDAALSGITASDGNDLALSDPFDQGTYKYTVTSHYDSGSGGVPSGVKIIATGAGDTAVEYKQDDDTYASGDPGDNSFTATAPSSPGPSVEYIRCTPAFTKAEIVYRVTITWVDDKAE